MIKSATLARRLTTCLIAAQLICGASATTTLLSTRSAMAAEMPVHGNWQGFTSTIGGRAVFGVRSKMSDGGTFAFMMNHAMSLILTHPAWNLSVGSTMPVQLRVDTKVYTALAIARVSNALELVDLSPRETLTASDATPIVIDLNHGAATWTLNLNGFDAAMRDAIRVYTASF